MLCLGCLGGGAHSTHATDVPTRRTKLDLSQFFSVPDDKSIFLFSNLGNGAREDDDDDTQTFREPR